jgi:flagellar basal-body rod modification protein FlgD
MIALDPMVGAAQANAAGTSSTSSSSKSPGINELGPDAFITLLTAQLQAQDPLNPMDPNQMVTELTSMNTLQETIQIRQDLDSLVAATKGSAASSGSGASASGASALNASAPIQGGSTNATPPLAAATMSSGLAAFVKSMVPGAAATFSALSKFKSQLF